MATGHLARKGLPLPVRQLNPDRYLPFTPRNENGVVYLFALAAEKLGFQVQSVQAAFPDCLATWGRKRVRIEFEFRSSNFERHGHDAKKCDLIVCWKHDWPTMPAGLAPLELRKLFGLAREVFIVAYREPYWSGLPDDREPSSLWSVPASAGPDDLLLIYRPQDGSGEGSITDVFRVNTPPERIRSPGWRSDPDWMAQIQRVAWLAKPIPFSRLRVLGAHGGIESRPRRTKQWPALYTELVHRASPSHSLKKYERL